MGVCNYEKEIYICAYIGLFYWIRKYIYKTLSKTSWKIEKERNKKMQKTLTSKKIIERRKEKGLETSNGKSKKQYIIR